MERAATSTAESLIAYPRPNPKASLRLFCFPYAGGGTTIFRTWPQGMPDDVEVVPIQLPGREGRLREPSFTQIKPLVQAVSDAMHSHLDKEFAFFGHSMGAIISFELARELRRRREPSPVHLFVSGRSAPQIPVEGPITYNLPEPELLRELRHLNGTPKEVLESPELMQLMLPIIRADFELVQTYVYSHEPPLDCPITVFGGLHDQYVSREDLEAWRTQTTGSFSLHVFQGDHFFINKEQTALLQVLCEELPQLARLAV